MKSRGSCIKKWSTSFQLKGQVTIRTKHSLKWGIKGLFTWREEDPRGRNNFSFALHAFIIWLAPRAGKMSQILRCDWLPERTRWSYLARSGLPVARSLGILSWIHEKCNRFLAFLVFFCWKMLLKVFRKFPTFAQGKGKGYEVILRHCKFCFEL